MAFIDTYISKYRTTITDSQKQNLKKIEEKLNTTVQNSHGIQFPVFLKNYGEQIYDILGRAYKYFDIWEFNWKNVFSAFSFVQSFSLEVYQIVRDLEKTMFAESWQAQEQFSKELIYFIWKTIGPLDKILLWLPFRQIIEKQLVLLLAGLGLETAHKLFNTGKNKEVSTFSLNNYVKAF